MSKSKLFTFLLIFLSFSAIFSFYNFDSASAQGVVWTYNAGTNTAKASGSGSTNFAALVAADVAGGWGVYTADASGIQIICAGKIQVGDGINPCVFTDTNKQVVFKQGCTTADFQRLINVAAGSTLTLGTKTNATYRICADGCQLINLNTLYCDWMLRANTPTATINVYACSFSDLGAKESYVEATESWDCQYLNAAYPLYVTLKTGTLYNGVVTSKYGFRTGIAWGGSVDNMLIHSPNRLFWIQNSGVTLSNIKAYGATWAGDSIRVESVSSDSYLVNVVIDSGNAWVFHWVSAGTYKVYRQYEFDLNVLNGEITDFVQNANVTLYKDGSKIYSALTNSSGMIPTQTLTYGYYQQSTGNNIQNATSPYYLVISHPDWQTYVSRFYITEPLRLTVSMQEPTYTGYSEVEKSDYTTIILFVISLILCIIGLYLAVPLLPLIALTVSVINVLLLTEISMFNILLIILNIIFTVITMVRVKTKNN